MKRIIGIATLFCAHARSHEMKKSPHEKNPSGVLSVHFFIFHPLSVNFT